LDIPVPCEFDLVFAVDVELLVFHGVVFLVCVADQPYVLAEEAVEGHHCEAAGYHQAAESVEEIVVSSLLVNCLLRNLSFFLEIIG
jgi:hypothetical protein